MTAFGVFWGIFMLIIMLGSGAGLENGVSYGIGKIATNSFFIWTQRATIPYKGFPRGRRFNFRNDDIQALRDNIPEIEYLAPKMRGWSAGDGSNNTIRNDRTGAFSIFGDVPEWNKIDPMDIIEGRFINNIDIKNRRKVAVIGTRVREVLFEPEENPIGEYIQIQGIYFQVVGVFVPLNTNINFGGEKEQSIFIYIYRPPGLGVDMRVRPPYAYRRPEAPYLGYYYIALDSVDISEVGRNTHGRVSCPYPLGGDLDLISRDNYPRGCVHVMLSLEDYVMRGKVFHLACRLALESYPVF